MSSNDFIGKCINDKYRVLKQIGQGGFGRVFLCENKFTQQQYAVKMIPVPKGGHHRSVDPKAEIEIHRKLANMKGRRFVKIVEDFEVEGAVYIVMEYCAEGSIKDFLYRHGPLHLLLATDILSQLIDALKLMHANKIMHRDLTIGNVLISEVRKGADGSVKKLHVKITDFGLSKSDVHGQLRTMLGTPAFMAPEVRQGKYTMAADVFSLGSIFYMLLTKQYLPGQTQQARADLDRAQGKLIRREPATTAGDQLDLETMFKSVISKNFSVREELSDAVRAHLKAFLIGLLCKENNRILLDEIDDHQFMKWFITEGFELDPELREMRSKSLSGQPGLLALVAGRRLSQSGTGSTGRQVEGDELLIRSNRDSALGSDHPSRSGNSRCHHLQIDPETGRCRKCSYRPALRGALGSLPSAGDYHYRRPSSSNTDRFSTEPPSLKYAQMTAAFARSLPNEKRRPILQDLDNNNRAVDNKTNKIPSLEQRLRHEPNTGRPPTTTKALPDTKLGTAPLSAPPRERPAGKENNNIATASSSSKPLQAPWPLPSVHHLQNYTAVNEFGRCSFKSPIQALSGARPQLVVVLEKTRSRQDATIGCIVEVWQGAEGQELRLFEPADRRAKCPIKADPMLQKGELVEKIRSSSTLCAANEARTAYETIWSFFRLTESKINQAYCEEIVGDAKWRLELRWNGYINVYSGPKGAKDLELKYFARQKTEGGPFEEVKGVSALSRGDRDRVEELARSLRVEVRASQWRRRQFEERNVRCTVYTRGYTS